MKKNFRFLLIGLMSLTLASGSVSALLVMPLSNKHQKFEDSFNNKRISYENLKKEVVDNSKSIKADSYYRFNNKDFYSKNDLNEEILVNGDLQTFATISKPEDIYLDIAHGILNPKKIERLDFKNYRRVYRTLYNQAVFDEEEALKSFANETNLLKEYSYDGVN
jgi:hypothetical protein